MHSDIAIINSPILEPWGNQLIPCNTPDECTVVNGTHVPELVYNSFCSQIAGIESLPGSAGYCVCPPYQMQGGVICNSPIGLGVPIWAAKVATSIPLDFLAVWTIRKLYNFKRGLHHFKRKPTRKRICLNINVQFWLLTIAVALNILENFGQMVVMVLTISSQVRRIARYCTTLVLVPVPFLLTIVATTFVATRFHRVTSSLTSSTHQTSSGFKVAVCMNAVMTLGTVVFILISLASSEFIYYAVATVWLTTFSCVYFVASVRETISRLKASSDMNQRSSTWAKVLSNSVKHFVCINLIGSILLCVVCYSASLPREVRDLTLSNIYHWPIVPYSIAIRALVYSVASFVHGFEVMAISAETSTYHSSEKVPKGVDNKSASPDIDEPVYAASDGDVMKAQLPNDLACTPTPAELAQEQVITVI